MICLRVLAGSMIKSSLKSFHSHLPHTKTQKHPIYLHMPTHITPRLNYIQSSLPIIACLSRHQSTAKTSICQNVNIYVAMLYHNIHDPWVSLGCQIRKLKYQEQCWNREKTDKAVKKMKLQILKVCTVQYCSFERSIM